MMCIYDTGFTQMKRSIAREVTLRAVLEMLFMFQPFGHFIHQQYCIIHLIIVIVTWPGITLRLVSF